MHRTFITLALLLGMLVPGSVSTSTLARADDWSRCRSDGVTEAISGCTAVLADASVSVEQRADAFLRRGKARLDNDDIGRAIEDFNSAIALDPDNGAAFFSRGRAHERAGRFLLAKQDFETAANVFESGPATGFGASAQPSPSIRQPAIRNGARDSLDAPPADEPEVRLPAKRKSAPKSRTRPPSKSQRLRQTPSTTRASTKRSKPRAKRQAIQSRKAKPTRPTKTRKAEKKNTYRKGKATRTTKSQRKGRAAYASEVDLKRKGGSNAFFEKLSEEGR